jgi:hypothetical protein
MDRTGLKILENNKNIQSIISVNTNILLRRFRLKFVRIICSTSCYKERVNFENTLYRRRRILLVLIFQLFLKLKKYLDDHFDHYKTIWFDDSCSGTKIIPFLGQNFPKI